MRIPKNILVKIFIVLVFVLVFDWVLLNKVIFSHFICTPRGGQGNYFTGSKKCCPGSHLKQKVWEESRGGGNFTCE